MIEIEVLPAKGFLPDENFIVRLIRADHEIEELTGEFERGGYNFSLSRRGEPLLESRGVKLAGRQTFLGHKAYELTLRGEPLGKVHRSYKKRILTADGRDIRFPRPLRRRVPELELKIPYSNFLRFRGLKGVCGSEDETTIMRAVCMTVIIWLKWNAAEYD